MVNLWKDYVWEFPVSFKCCPYNIINKLLNIIEGFMKCRAYKCGEYGLLLSTLYNI